MTSKQALEQLHAALPSMVPAADVRNDIVQLMRNEAAIQAGEGESAMVAQRHPLGFFACKWELEGGRTLRLHLWSKEFGWAQEPGWEIHDHVFSFSSLLLFGALRNRTYDIEEASGTDAEYSVYDVTYKGSESSMNLIRKSVGLKLTSDAEESAAASYSMNGGVLHSSDLMSERAMTVLATWTDQACPEVARVVSAHQHQRVAFDRSPPLRPHVAALLMEFAQHADLER
jgi:hypothetical protein